jgi:hypothetical protein
VALQIARRADPRRGLIQQAERGGEHALPIQVGSSQGRRHAAAGLGKGGGELECPRELAPVPPLAPPRVVQVLTPSGVIDPDRLNVSHRVDRDPHVVPRRRDHQLLDPFAVVGIGRGPLRIDVAESVSGSHPPVSRVISGAHPDQSRHVVSCPRASGLRATSLAHSKSAMAALSFIR